MLFFRACESAHDPESQSGLFAFRNHPSTSLRQSSNWFGPLQVIWNSQAQSLRRHHKKRTNRKNTSIGRLRIHTLPCLFAERLRSPLCAVQEFDLYILLRRTIHDHEEIQTGVHLAGRQKAGS
jgi:hypothetical protein